jgi:hypothetical protein
MLTQILSKATWIWERKRPYFSSHAFFQLLPVSSAQGADKPTINVLCTPTTLTEAAFSAWSWCKYLGSSFGIRIVVDGEFDRDYASKIGNVLNGINILGARDLIDPDLFLMKGLGPLGQSHPMGRKLLIPLSLQRYEDHIYVDNDVLLFNYPYEVMEAKLANKPAYNQETGEACYNLDILQRALDLSLNYCTALNGGLFYCPRYSLDIDIANELALAKIDKPYSWFDEQTIYAVLMNQAEARGLKKESYVVSTQRQFWPDRDVDYSLIASRHFTAPVRHLMYSRGYSYLHRSCALK